MACQSTTAPPLYPYGGVILTLPYPLEEMGEEEGSGVAAVHTAHRPYCADLLCWCHHDAQYHTIILQKRVVTDEEVAIALSYLLQQQEGSA